MARISQREARRLRRRIEELEQREERRLRAWSQEYFGGVEIARLTLSTDTAPDVIRTARKLKHAVVVVGDESDTIRFMALPLAK